MRALHLRQIHSADSIAWKLPQIAVELLALHLPVEEVCRKPQRDFVSVPPVFDIAGSFRCCSIFE